MSKKFWISPYQFKSKRYCSVQCSNKWKKGKHFSPDTEFKITELLNDKASWSGGQFPQFLVHDAENKQYSVRGSPTLVINEQIVSSARDSASYLATVCSAFNTAPEECNEKLSGVSPSSGFGLDSAAATGGSNAAICS